MKPFDRVTRIADFRRTHGSIWPVFLRTQWDGRRLSMTGVEGPKRNGDAMGSCGQLNPPAEHHVNRIPEYDRICEVWDHWHLNDMRAGCEHQRAMGWGKGWIEVVAYSLTSEAYQLRREAEAEAIRAAIAGEVASLSAIGRALIGPDWFRDLHAPPDADSPLSGLYEVKKREIRPRHHVRPDEHPEGVLSKPCPTCGYQYGTAWLHEDVPEDVLAFLAGLPDDSEAAAWA